jgi:serine/threonine-protein kinase
MELLEGATFDKYIAQHGRLSPEEAIPILHDIGRALDAAHAHGIAHRDLKPENVFVSFDEDGRCDPTLLDFGIAKLLGDEPGQHKTKSGAMVGTPRYMSPEQCRGKDVDHRTDIYAFGVMTHEVLTGKPPFSGDSAMDLMFKHAKEAPPSMSSVCPAVPAALDAPVLRMLAKDPAARPQSLAEAMAELSEVAVDAGFAVSLSKGTVSSTGARRASGLASTSVDIQPGSQTMGALETEVAPRSGSTRIMLATGGALLVGVVATLAFLGSRDDQPAAAASAAPGAVEATPAASVPAEATSQTPMPPTEEPIEPPRPATSSSAGARVPPTPAKKSQPAHTPTSVPTDLATPFE